MGADCYPRQNECIKEINNLTESTKGCVLHHIKNPLAVIISSLDLSIEQLAGGNDQPAWRDSMADTLRCALAAAWHLDQDLTALGFVDAGRGISIGEQGRS